MLHRNRTIELGLLSACAWIFSCVLMPVAVDAHDESPRAAGHSMHSEAYDEGPRQAAYLMDGMPELEFPVSTASEEAQRFFNQGIGQLHGFWYFEAERSFRQVALLDTNCIMALWGMAMANHSNEKRAKEFLERAIVRTNDVNTTARERLYIHSLAKFHGATLPPKPDQDAKDKPKDAGKAEAAKDQNAAKKAESTKPKTRTDEEENQRHRDYIKDLEQIVEDNPDDLEAKAFLVFKIWDAQGRMRIRSHMATEALAQEVLRARPLHPVHHGRIHFWNYEADRRAVDAAAKCGQGSPGIAHMWHMPGHTYDALHRYADAAWQQEASARVDHAYMIRNRVLPDQIHNFAHNNEWLVRTLNKLGRIEEAIDLAKNMIELPRHPRWNNLSRLSLTNSEGKISDSAYKGADRKMSSASFGRARLIETLVNWELWDQTLQLGNTMYLDPTELPEEQVQRLRVLALACFAKGDIEAGSQHVDAIEQSFAGARQWRAADVDAAEIMARSEKKSDDDISKAMRDALQAHSRRINAMQQALDETRLFQALARGESDKARRLAEEAKDISKLRMSRVWASLDETNKAVEAASKAVEGATNQVLALAVQVELLNRFGKTNECRDAFEKLRKISSHASLGMPALQRLAPLAESMGLPSDWRPAFEAAKDTGDRPALDSLGPFRWKPSAAPDWDLPTADGTRLTLERMKGRPLLVIFYLGHGCRHCLDQLNIFAPMADDYDQSGIRLVAVSTDSVDGLKKTFEQSKSGKGFPFPIVADPELATFRKYRAFDDFEQTPLHGTFLIDGDGLVRWHDISYEPFVHAEFLLHESRRLLQLPVQPSLLTAAGSTPISTGR